MTFIFILYGLVAALGMAIVILRRVQRRPTADEPEQRRYQPDEPIGGGA